MFYKTYFISDFHLGIPSYEESLKREKLIVQWFDEVKHDAKEIYLMGDLFDFWFEYKTVVPKGFVRLLGKLAEITDAGIKVHLFKGNHDLWAFDYLWKELNIILHRKPEIVMINNKKFYLAHGDGLGPDDKGYKFLKHIFENHINQWLFRWLHPDIAIKIAIGWSRQSRCAKLIKGKNKPFKDIKTENLFKYIRSILNKHNDIDYFIFAHRHIPIDEKITEKARYINPGDWLTNFSYAVFDGQELELKFYPNKHACLSGGSGQVKNK